MSKVTPRTGSNAKSEVHGESEQPLTVSPKWLASAIGIAIAAAILCTWGAICFTFWQGSWQLLYHPTAPITRTPASAGLAFDNVEFAPSQAGVPQLRGWWIPAEPESRYTAIFLHGANGNLSDAVDALARLHAAKLDILAFDYRGYGQSEFIHPSEAHWREDAESAIQYLRDTRHIPAGSIVLVGTGLGANLALQVAAEHSELAGVVLDDPLEAPTETIFHDPRARMVPARLLVSDRWDSNTPSASLRIPSLWFVPTVPPGRSGLPDKPDLFQAVKGPKMLVTLVSTRDRGEDFRDAVARWLEDLPNKGRNLPESELGGGSLR
jgi:uncharacterized protein